MKTKSSFRVLTVLPLVLFACSQRGSSEPSTMAPTSSFELDVGGRKLLSAEPAQIRASLGSVSLYDFWFAAGDKSGSVLVNARLPATDKGSDSFVLSVSNGPIGDGVASVQVTGTGSSPDLTGATVHVNVTPNAVNGELVLPSSGDSWTFAGKAAVTCWVPSASIAGGSPNVGGTSANTALVRDVAFASDACTPLRNWAGK